LFWPRAGVFWPLAPTGERAFFARPKKPAFLIYSIFCPWILTESAADAVVVGMLSFHVGQQHGRKR
jgi:hypothetical protein